MTDNSDEIDPLLSRARSGNPADLDAVFSKYREALTRMVHLRLDRRLQGRIDASDVVQEAYVDAVRKLDDYLADPRAPLFLWLRHLVGLRLKSLHRHHFGVKQRDVRLDVSIYSGPMPSADSTALAARLLGKLTSPSQAAIRTERMLNLQEVLDSMSPTDREILSLRHFEELSRAEAALELGIEEAAAGKRYLRALQRLRRLLEDPESK